MGIKKSLNEILPEKWLMSEKNRDELRIRLSDHWHRAVRDIVDNPEIYKQKKDECLRIVHARIKSYIDI